MIYCHDLIRDFQFEHVALTAAEKKDMENKRELNLSRAQRGLEANNKPAIVKTINQGGKAMDTMTHQPEGDTASRYDIDMGVVFEEDDAIGALTTRRWIADAISEAAPNSMVNDPEVKPKCVRVTYSNGYQCDFPVFRRIASGDTYRYQVSIGSDWVDSDPGAVNKWFRNAVKENSPETDGDYQLRRIVRLAKYFAKVRVLKTGKKFPAGLLVTALVVNNYVPVGNRDDESFYKTLIAIRDSLRWSKQVSIDGMLITDSKDAVRLDRLVDAIEKVKADLKRVVDEDDLTNQQVFKAWKRVFSHSYFDTAAAQDKVASSDAGLIETKSSSGGLGLAVGALAAGAALGIASAAAMSRREGEFEPTRAVNKDGGGTSG